MKKSLFFLLPLGWMLFHPAFALAHKINIFAYIDNQTVYTESYFSDGKPVRNGTITVVQQNKHILLHGKTDAQGLFNFPLTEQETLIIEINGGMGHKNSFTLQPHPEN